jgi:acyl carrier protein
VERTIATVWEETLQVEHVGMHDNFFDLGGNSLLVVRVQSRLQELLQRDLPMVQLFAYPTVSALAQYLTQEESASPSFQQSRDRAQTRRASMRQRRILRRARGADEQ